MNRPVQRSGAISHYVTEYDGRLDQALNRARNLSEHELLSLPVESITQALADEYCAAVVIIDFDQLWWKLEDLPTLSPRIVVNVPARGCTGALLSQALT